MIVTSCVLMLRVLICMVVYQKASVGVYLFCCICSKKKKSEIKRRNKFLKEKKNRKERKKKKMSEREIPKIELFSCIIFNKRLEENTSCFGFSIGMSFKVVDLSCKHVEHLSFLVFPFHLPFTIHSPFIHPLAPLHHWKPLWFNDLWINCRELVNEQAYGNTTCAIVMRVNT